MNKYLSGEFNMKLKKIAGALIALAAVATLAACGGNNNSSSSKDESLESVKKAGVLTVATSPDFAPFEFQTKVDGKNKVVGADIDLVNAIADELGVKVQIKQMSFDAVLAYVQQGKADIGASGITATADRKKNLNFTDSYYNPEQVLVVNKKDAATIKTVADLKDKKIAAQKGSIQEAIIQDQIKGSTLVSLKTVPDMAVQLKQGTIAGMLLDGPIAESYVETNSDLTTTELTFSTPDDEAFSLALPKDADALTTEINKIIKKLADEGKIDEFVKTNNELAAKSDSAE